MRSNTLPLALLVFSRRALIGINRIGKGDHATAHKEIVPLQLWYPCVVKAGHLIDSTLRLSGGS